MSIRGKWGIVRMPDYEADFPDMMGPAYILFGKSGGEFAFGCDTGAIHGTTKSDAVDFTWSGKWRKPAATNGPSYNQTGPSKDRFAFQGGGEADFIAKPWRTSSTAC